MEKIKCNFLVILFIVTFSFLFMIRCYDIKSKKVDTGHPTAFSDRPVLYNKIAIPDSFLTKSRGLLYGGDIRIGDLQNNGSIDILVYRAANSIDGGAVQPCFIGAFTTDGELLWQHGEGGLQPNRPGPVAIYDIDADGQTEVLTFFASEIEKVEPHTMKNMKIQILDGKTGAVKKEAEPDIFNLINGKGPNWVHQRLLIANLRGNPTPQDFIIKLGTTILAFDHNLNLLWKYQNIWDEYGNCPAYVPAVGDMDGDGRDEINGGYFVLSPDGQPVWEKKLGKNMDAVAIDKWDNGNFRAFCSGYGHIMDIEGNVILDLGEEVVPHGQELRVAHYDDSVPGPQMMIRYKGHERNVMLVANNGQVLRRFKVNESPNNTGMEAVYWQGNDQPALLYNGGILWNGKGEMAYKLPGLPPEQGNKRQGWYHCIPGNYAGDEREEVLVYNPWDLFVYIFSPDPIHSDQFQGYQPEARQYNVRIMD